MKWLNRKEEFHPFPQGIWYYCGRGLGFGFGIRLGQINIGFRINRFWKLITRAEVLP